jgi:single-stranded-DNA-specific exonuclease RecJ
MAGDKAGSTSVAKENLGKRWVLPSCDEPNAEQIAAANNSTVLASVLMARGLREPSCIKSFLDQSLYTPTDPLALPNCQKAVDRLIVAIEKQEPITVYGDYDVDGVTGTSVLLTVLRSLGAKVSFYIPNRSTEGYGLNLKAVSVLASKHRTKLIVTCDCGVSNFAEINLAKSLGVDSLILDHHTMPELLPPAVAVVHPKLLEAGHALFNLPGVGVAYKVCEALLKQLGRGEEAEQLLDYVTLGMIADLVPLVDENRYLVKIGLASLVRSKRPGIQALLAQVGTKEDTDLVGFGMAPRINAVGRLADASVAVELLTTDSSERAAELAQQLELDNARRQALCEQIYMDAEHMVLTTCDLERDKGIVIYKEGWHHGVVGIVASRLVERFSRPVFIGELESEEGLVRGSARGVEQVDLYEILKANEHLLTKWGGHKMAAGFSMEASKAQAACAGIVASCNKFLEEKSLRGKVDVDACIAPSVLSLPLAKELTAMAPFGMANRKPILYLENLMVTSCRPLGKEGKHGRILMQDRGTGKDFEAVMWNTRGRVPLEGHYIDLVFNADINNFNNRERLQLVLVDWREAGKGNDEEELPLVTAAVRAEVSKLDASGKNSAGKSRSSVSAGGSSGVLAVNANEVQALEGQLSVEELERVETKFPGFVRLNFKDLRHLCGSKEVVRKAFAKLGSNLAVYNESGESLQDLPLVALDRAGILEKKSEHLLLWQYPPALKNFQEMVLASGAGQVYLVGCDDEASHEPQAFLRKILGIIRFAVNQKDGQVEADKFACLLGSTKLAVALALGALKSVHCIDWFAENGVINLEILGDPAFSLEETQEYKQLTQVLAGIKSFRQWCKESSLKELQLAVMPNQVSMEGTSSLEEDSPVVSAESI